MPLDDISLFRPNDFEIVFDFVDFYEVGIGAVILGKILVERIRIDLDRRRGSVHDVLVLLSASEAIAVEAGVLCWVFYLEGRLLINE